MRIQLSAVNLFRVLRLYWQPSKARGTTNAGEWRLTVEYWNSRGVVANATFRVGATGDLLYYNAHQKYPPAGSDSVDMARDFSPLACLPPMPADPSVVTSYKTDRLVPFLTPGVPARYPRPRNFNA